MDFSLLGKEPVPGDKPAGNDCRYEPSFESLQAEIDKLSSPTASGKVDWSKIVECASTILAEQSKDLTVAGYLAVGLVCTRQIDGLDDGVQILSDLVEHFWDDLFPPRKRMRGRAGAFAWWLEKTEEELEKLKSGPIPEAQAARIQKNINALDDQLADKMPDPPLFRPVQRQIERIPVQATEKKEPPPQEVPAAQGVTEAAAPPPKLAAPSPGKPLPDVVSPQAIESEQDAKKGVDEAIALLRKASHFLIQQDLKNPLAYRYRRLASWAKIESPPPHTDGLTQIPPPAPMVIGSLTDLRDEGNWPGLIQNAEQKVSQFVFWFDLNCMVAEGLKQMGPDYQKALNTVCYETACFFQRLPEVETFSFADGMPFAEPHTRKWLDAIRLGEGGGGQAAGGVGSDADDEFNAIVQQALAMGRKKQLVQAVDLLQIQMLSSTSRCRQLRWRLAIVRVLLAVKKSQLAIPHLDKIIADIDAFNLEEWDPAAALEGLTAVWKGYNAQSANEQKVRAVEILNRIARINPAEALRLVNK